MKMVKGSCNCNAVQFEISLPITDIYVCHCSICRKASGGNGVSVAVVNNQHFAWLTGTDKIKTWHKPNHDWVCSFCTQCGSNLPGKNDDQRMYVPVGLIANDDLAGAKVVQHMWVSSKACWEEIGDEGQQHDGFIG
ncbi:GFA family protein [Pseudoalteromonas luteoviolacea]|nr:GFA family protein [Pseudoalteromonas luteoviolacea]